MEALKLDLLIRRANLATMEGSGWGEAANCAVGVRDGKIAWIGSDADLPSSCLAQKEVDAEGAWLLPGFIDCHTHLVYAGDRSAEFEARMQGATYQEIAASGGGILSTVRATRDSSVEALAKLAQQRLNQLASEGVTTVEVKTGYGLSLEAELAMLGAAERLTGARILKTLLAAHTVPPEHAGDPDQWVDEIIQKVIPAAAPLIDAVDAFCETIAFSPEQVRRVFQAARARGIPVKLHADQLSDTGGGALAAEFGALSADHLEYCSEASARAMAAAGTVAVLLPGAFYMLRETRVPPVNLLRELGVPMAVATDHNPGTSPCLSISLIMNMACVFFGLTPLEAVRGTTVQAAKALGIFRECGSLVLGKRADLALHRVSHPREIPAQVGANACARRWTLGCTLES